MESHLKGPEVDDYLDAAQCCHLIELDVQLAGVCPETSEGAGYYNTAERPGIAEIQT